MVNSVDGKLQFLISECRLLFKKAMYKKYFKTVTKAKAYAVKHERYGYLLQLLDIEKIIIPKEDIQTLKSRNLFNEAIDANGKIRNLFEYSNLISELLNNYRKYGLNREESHKKFIDTFTETDIMSSPIKAKSIRALEAFYRVKEISSTIKADNEAIYEALIERFRIVTENPEPFKDYIIHYPSDILYSLAETCIKMNKFNEAETYMQNIKEYSKQDLSMEDDFEIYVYYARLRIFLKQGSVKDAVKLIPRLEMILKKYENKILMDTELSIKFYIVKCRIEENNFQQALIKANDLMNHPLLHKRADYECYIKILYLIIHFELKNYELLKHLLVSTYRYLYKHEKIFKVELLIFEFIRKLPSVKKDDDLDFMFRNLGKKLSKLKLDEYEKNAFEYFDILKWVNKKISLNHPPF